jgi:hypothetical protein
VLRAAEGAAEGLSVKSLHGVEELEGGSEGSAVGVTMRGSDCAVGDSEGDSDEETSVGSEVGTREGSMEGVTLGARLGTAVGTKEGITEGVTDGA